MGRSELFEFGDLVRTWGFGKADPPAAKVIVRELGARNELFRLRRSAVYAGEGVANGEGRPVLMLPGFMADQRTMATMTSWLVRNGYDPEPYGGRDLRCGEVEVRRLARRLEAVAHHRGMPVALIGHSRGGHLARVLAVRHPELVAGVVTLCTPGLGRRCAHRVVGSLAMGTALLGALGVPYCWRPSCFDGECCQDYRADLEAPMPADVGYTQILSSGDLIVDRVLAADPEARQVEIASASHVGALFNAEAFEAIAEALAGFGAAERRVGALAAA